MKDSTLNKNKIFFLIGPHLKHTDQLNQTIEKLGDKITVFRTNSEDDYNQAIQNIRDYSTADPQTKIRIVVDAHGVEKSNANGSLVGTGQLSFGNKDSVCEIYPAEIAKQLSDCNVQFIDCNACCIGTGIESKNNENLPQYQDIPKNVPIFLNGGHRRQIMSLLQPEIIRTMEIEEENCVVENFIGKMFQPNTLKVILKNDADKLLTYKTSAPKPKSAQDLAPQSIRNHIENEIDKALGWWQENVDQTINKEELETLYKGKINDDLINQYQGQALIMETHRGKADYVKHYLDAGVNPNSSLSDGTTPLSVSFKYPEISKNLLQHPNTDVNYFDVDKISILCAASYGRNNKEMVDLIINHPNFNQNLESFNQSRENFKNNYLTSEYHNMNDPLVNYVRAKLSLREGNIGDAKNYMDLAINGETKDEARKVQYQEALNELGVNKKSFVDAVINERLAKKTNHQNLR